MHRKKYYIFRHGETFVTKSKSPLKLYGLKTFSAHILPEGIPVIERMAQYLKNIPADTYISSPYVRCRETSAIVTQQTKKEFIQDKRLSDYFVETFWTFRKRLKNLLQDVESEKNETIVICTHGVVIAGLTRLLTKGSFRLQDAFTYRTKPGILTIIDSGEITRIDFNAR